MIIKFPKNEFQNEVLVTKVPKSANSEETVQFMLRGQSYFLLQAFPENWI